MTTLFIADVHLSIQRPNITNHFLYFLKNYTNNVKSLYILGDLFEIWLGDDNLNSLHEKIAIEVKKLTKKGITCYFIHGNHDFLLGQQYADYCNMKLLSTQQVIEISGYRLVILHGDILCTNDIIYQKLRYITCQVWLQKFFLKLPLYIRIKLASLIQNNTTQFSIKKKNINKMYINPNYIIKILLQTKSKILIHGHTHQPAIHKIMHHSKTYYRITLGSWFSSISFLRINQNGINLVKI